MLANVCRLLNPARPCSADVIPACCIQCMQLLCAPVYHHVVSGQQAQAGKVATQYQCSLCPVSCICSVSASQCVEAVDFKLDIKQHVCYRPT